MESPGFDDHLAVVGAGDGCASALTVRWDRQAQCFQVHTLPLNEGGYQLIADKLDGSDSQDEADLLERLERFVDAICNLNVPAEAENPPASDNGASRPVALTLKRLTTQRDDVLDRLLASKTPLVWLEQFLSSWETRLADLVALADAAAVHFSRWLAQELLVLAAGYQIIGKVSEARRASGTALRVARTARKRPTSADLSSPAAEIQQSASRALLAYVAFEAAAAKNSELLRRHGAPSQILAQLTVKFGALRLQAPLSIPILTVLVSLMESQQRHTIVTRLLAASPLTSLDANLTLLYARTLERDGCCSRSIAVARQYLDNPRVTPLDQGLRDRLEAHAARLASLQQLRSQAERHVRVNENDCAISSFSKCLELIQAGVSSDKVKASLLLGRATALLAVGKTAEARRDLETSVKLNPNDAVAQLVLKTTLLEEATSRIKMKLAT